MFTQVLFALAALTAFASAQNNNKTVSLTVYYESLCPDSQKFINSQLAPNYNAMKEHVSITLVPYGKTTIDGTNITCHHKEVECYGNKVQACILKGTLIPNKDDQMKLISCLMSKVPAGVTEETYPLKLCLDNSNMTGKEADLKTCVTDEGLALLKEMGAKTDKFEKPLLSVPATAVNDVKNMEAVGDLKTAVCKKWTDNQKPGFCPKSNGAFSLMASSLLLGATLSAVLL